MGCSVRQIEQLSAKEIAEWEAFFTLEPFGPQRDNWHAAGIAHILANANRKPGTPEIPFQNFMYMDPETRRILKDRQMVKMFEQRSKKNG